MGVLQVPETGAIEIAAIGGKPVTGVYALMTCTTGGETLRNWTVNFTGEWYGAERTVLIDETGLRLAVKVRKGTVVTVR
jgi:acyl CoA:acetate/3-ketoacid CoA transferase beta subunit